MKGDPAEISNITNHTTEPFLLSYRFTLVFLYVLIFVGGIMGVILMSTLLKSNMLSVTTVSVINLMVVHAVFLLTVPFRIYYYFSSHWDLGHIFCRLISGMLHGHMYLCFIFYTIILSTRYLAYFEWRQRLEFYRVLHAITASLTIWIIILGSALPATLMTYGKGIKKGKTCFAFGNAVQKLGVKVLNYVLSATVLLIWTGLASCQLYILWKVWRKHGKSTFSHQEFWAQIKSLFFLLIMFICFVPYQSFRIYYVRVYGETLELINEVFLAITAFSCFDMLIFGGRDIWRSVTTNCCFICDNCIIANL